MPSAGLRWRRVFVGEERELTDLRRWLGMLLPQGAPRDDVVSVATELASNAIKHTSSGRGGWFAVEIALAHPSSAVRVCVADGGAPKGPRMVDEPLAEHGRGLMLVQGLSARTGVSGDRRGRVVWADVPWPVAVAQPARPARDPLEAAIRAAQAELAKHFAGIPIWFGRATMQWWALVVRPGFHQLVNGASPEALAVALVRALEAPLPLRVATSQAGGTGSRYHRDRRSGTVTPGRFPAGRGSLHRVAGAGHGPSAGPHPTRPGHATTLARRAS